MTKRRKKNRKENDTEGKIKLWFSVRLKRNTECMVLWLTVIIQKLFIVFGLLVENLMK